LFIIGLLAAHPTEYKEGKSMVSTLIVIYSVAVIITMSTQFAAYSVYSTSTSKQRRMH